MYIHTHTCDVCKKSLRISLQLNDHLHTPQVCGHPPQHVYCCVLINTAITLQTTAVQTFTLTHSNSNMLFASRTTFSLLQQLIFFQWISIIALVLLQISLYGFSPYNFHACYYARKVQDNCISLSLASNGWDLLLLIKFFWEQTRMYFTVQHRIYCVTTECRYIL